MRVGAGTYAHTGNENLGLGKTIEWPPSDRGDGRAISSGIYWLKVEDEDWETARAITVIR